jgi:tRNA A58 N-methylase Trm61
MMPDLNNMMQMLQDVQRATENKSTTMDHVYADMIASFNALATANNVLAQSIGKLADAIASRAEKE